MLKTIDKIKEGSKILLRLDLNSAVVDKNILEGPRFEEATKTISELIKKNSKIVILAHQGRKGSNDFLPLKQHSLILSNKLQKKVLYVPDLFGKGAQNAINSDEKIILLENTRFWEDEQNLETANFKKLCSNFDAYVNDAFSVSHRAQASIILPPKYLPSFAGPNLFDEIKSVEKLLSFQKKRLVYIIGGSKPDDYFDLCNKLKNKHNRILVSGVFANLFLISSGMNLGYENTWAEEQGYEIFYPKLRKLLKTHKQQIILPVDAGIGDRIVQNAQRTDIALSRAPFTKKIWDVGPATITLFKKYLSDAEAVFMKGPLGYSEIPAFSFGTREILNQVSSLNKKGVYTFIGGGHLTTTIKKYNIENSFSHISTSGGSLMHALAGKKLPGIEALKKSKL